MKESRYEIMCLTKYDPGYPFFLSFEIPSDIDRVMSVLISVKVLLSLSINEPSWRLLLVKAVECGGQMKTDAAFRPMKWCEIRP